MKDNSTSKEILELKLLMEKNFEVLIKVVEEKKELPMILTTKDLKDIFQVSDSTINRLISLSSFPECWYGIRGHYPRDKVFEWFKKHDYEEYKSRIAALRKL